MKIGIVVLGKLGLPIAFEIESKEHKVFHSLMLLLAASGEIVEIYMYYLKKFHFDLNLKIYNNSK